MKIKLHKEYILKGRLGVVNEIVRVIKRGDLPGYYIVAFSDKGRAMVHESYLVER